MRSNVEPEFRPTVGGPFRQDLDEALLGVSKGSALVVVSSRSKVSGTGTRDTLTGPRPNNLCIEKIPFESAGVRTPIPMRVLKRLRSVASSFGDKECQCKTGSIIGVASASGRWCKAPPLGSSLSIVHLWPACRLRRMEGRMDVRRGRRPLWYKNQRAKTRQRTMQTMMGVKI